MDKDLESISAPTRVAHVRQFLEMHSEDVNIHGDVSKWQGFDFNI
jgi:hypothetical protein